MIHLTRINHLPLVLNCDLIEHLEATPDTVISLTNGQKFMVMESIEEVIRRIVEFRRAVFAAASETGVPQGPGAGNPDLNSNA
jgi:flagellar protein FlbD